MNVSGDLSRYKVAFGEDYRDLRLESFENVEEAFLRFYQKNGTFVLEVQDLNDLTSPRGKVAAKYRIIAAKPSPTMETIPITINVDDAFPLVKEVILT